MTAASVMRPPHLSKLPDYPVTGGAMVLSVIVTAVFWANPSAADPLAVEASAFHTEPWRLVTSMLPHLGIFHLAFNLYWVWRFGTVLEERLGSAALAGLVVLTAAASSAAEYILFNGGLGISGVLYGFFGLLQVLKARDPRFLGTLDRSTETLLVGWFFLAIVLDVTGIMGVANAAHAGGWGMGALLGFVVGARHPRQRIAAGVGTVAVFVGLWFAATVGLAAINLDGLGHRELYFQAEAALEAGDVVQALEYYEQAADYGETDRELWAWVAVRWEMIGMPERAAEAWARSGRTPDQVPPPPKETP
ncbi:MAG: rhomboid family intramembrane serine protease [Proteobacteria bacterium]|nr:rhomboid family intramembrane serine protease [Pseudomonadota bacterium]